MERQPFSLTTIVSLAANCNLPGGGREGDPSCNISLMAHLTGIPPEELKGDANLNYEFNIASAGDFLRCQFPWIRATKTISQKTNPEARTKLARKFLARISWETGGAFYVTPMRKRAASGGQTLKI